MTDANVMAQIKRLGPYVLAALAASAPAWVVHHPPLTDLPYHLAAIRVIHSLNDPQYGMSDVFVLTLSRTQYLLYYGLGSALSYVTGVWGANALLMSAYLAGTVLAARAFLLSVGGDPRACLLTIPLLTNTLFFFGLMPFLIGIPLLFVALALAHRSFEHPSTWRRAAVGLIAISLFFTHVVPFAVFVLGFAALFPWRRTGRAVAAAPLVPAGILALAWVGCTDAGRVTGQTLDQVEGGTRPFGDSLSELPGWICGAFRDGSDATMVVATAILVAVATVVSWKDRRGSAAPYYFLVPLLCINAYFILPAGAAFVWPLAQRFAVVAVLTAIPLVSFPRGRSGAMVTGAAACLAAASIINVSAHFIEFERTEVAGFDSVLASIPGGKKVCALMFETGSAITNRPSFLHFGSYYQAEKGGMVMHTFAGYPHWPFDFKPGGGPPGGAAPPRWEWMPEKVSVEREIVPYYDYVLVRGGDFHPPEGMLRLEHVEGPWQVWSRLPN